MCDEAVHGRTHGVYLDYVGRWVGSEVKGPHALRPLKGDMI